MTTYKTHERWQGTVTWTRAKLDEFKRVYQTSCKSDDGLFEFQGMEFYCGYARYLIEYLDGVLEEDTTEYDNLVTNLRNLTM